MLGVERLVYITGDPRNPTTPTLQDWDYLSGRHRGLKRDDHDKLRRTKKGETYQDSPNCGRVETISALREFAIDGADTSGVICQTCPQFEACKGGHVFGYLNKRAIALKARQFIAHPASLPHVEQAESSDDLDRFSYDKTALIWEEWRTIFKNTKQITVTSSDVEKLLLRLITQVPEQLSQLQPLLTQLHKLLSGQVKAPNRYGWNHHSLVEQLPPLPEDLDLKALARCTQPDLTFLNPTSEEGIDIEDLPAGVRKRFTDTDEATSQTAKATLLKQWLIPFLEVLGGGQGYLSLNYGKLSVTLLNNHYVEIARAAAKNIFLDATADSEELALLLGVSRDDIIHIQQEQPVGASLEIIQVFDLGRLGLQRGEDQRRRVDAIIKHLKAQDDSTGIIRFKRYAEPGDYRWHIESRGVNDGEKLNILILDGIPCPNLESLRAEFACLYNRVPKDEDLEFEEFVNRRIWAEIHQAIGRLRASRRPGENLQVYLLGDFPMDVPVTPVKASDITLEAAGKVERVEIAIARAVEELKAMGQKVTQQSVANLTGYTRGHISRFQKLIILLIKGSISKMINGEDVPSGDRLVS